MLHMQLLHAKYFAYICVYFPVYTSASIWKLNFLPFVNHLLIFFFLLDEKKYGNTRQKKNNKKNSMYGI